VCFIERLKRKKLDAACTGTRLAFFWSFLVPYALIDLSVPMSLFLPPANSRAAGLAQEREFLAEKVHKQFLNFFKLFVH
jgi:hypothetical protein